MTRSSADHDHNHGALLCLILKPLHNNTDLKPRYLLYTKHFDVPLL